MKFTTQTLAAKYLALDFFSSDTLTNMSLTLRKFICKGKHLPSVRFISCGNETDFSKSVEEFKRNGVTILPLKVDADFVKESKKLCLGAWEDALDRGKIIKGHDIKVGQEHGFKEIVHRASGRYDMQWKIDGNPHFLNKDFSKINIK